MLVPAAINVPSRGGQTQTTIEPGDENQPGRDRGQYNRQATEAEAHDVESAEPDANEHDAKPQHGRDAKLQAGGQSARKRKQVPQEQAKDDGDRDARDRDCSPPRP